MFRVLVAILLGACLARCELYEFSDEYINKINEEVDTWTAGRNFPADTSREYLNNFLIGDERFFNATEWPTANQRKLRIPEYGELSVPESFDARKHWPQCNSIALVPDSGACAASQIYAAVAAFTDRRCIKSKGQHTELLSTEYVASCCKRCRYDEAKSCSHGSVFKTWIFLHYRGSVTGGLYGENNGCQPSSIQPCSHYGTASNLPSCETVNPPTLRCHTRCTNEEYGRGFFSDKHKATIPYWLDDKEEIIKKELMANGPTTATLILYDDFFHYKSGVYKHAASAKTLNFLQSAKLIGWGVENGTPYWLLINTWGVNWGDKGTVKILRGHYECSLEYLVAAAKPKS